MNLHNDWRTCIAYVFLQKKKNDKYLFKYYIYFLTNQLNWEINFDLHIRHSQIKYKFIRPKFYNLTRFTYDDSTNIKSKMKFQK